MILVVHGQHFIEHLFLSVERETEVSDTASLAFFHQEVQHAVVDIAVVEFLHASADGVQQVIVEIIDL